MNSILKDTEQYYTDKALEHGISPKGVDWKDAQSQHIRFDQLLNIIGTDEVFTLADLGCGYGALFSYMETLGLPDFTFYGYDLSAAMIENAKAHAGAAASGTRNKSVFTVIDNPSAMQDADYIVASGIFNVKMDHSDEAWHDYIIETITAMHDKSRKGFAFNVLTKYSDAAFMRGDLHYADPLILFDYCKRNFSRNVALLHDYNLYEFTVLVRK